jgi:hypothetical protein
VLGNAKAQEFMCCVYFKTQNISTSLNIRFSAKLYEINFIEDKILASYMHMLVRILAALRFPTFYVEIASPSVRNDYNGSQ